MGIQKLKIVKSVPTFHGHNFGSFWARDSSKKAFFSSWLAMSNGLPRARMALSREIWVPTPKSSIPGESNGVKWEGNTRRAVHVQGDWKLCTCTARRNKKFRAWVPAACSSAQWDASNGTKLSIFWEKSGTRHSWSLAIQLLVLLIIVFLEWCKSSGKMSLKDLGPS